MSKVRSFTGLFAAAVVASPVTLLMPATGWAQQIEEIVVTTRRQSESLQEVPIAVTAIGAEQIDRQGISGLGDVAKLDPSVQFDTSYGPGDTRVAIRGLSNTRGRSNVAFLIDGIDVTTENFIAAGSGLLANQRLLTDVERIEIVKGPQSALYGRAAFAGAISYVTKEPSDVFEAKVRADVGDYGRQQYSGFVSSPIGETQGFRADGVVWGEDGYYRNDYTGNKVGGGEGFGLSGTYVWEPNDLFKGKARASYSDDHYDVRPNYHLKTDKYLKVPEQAYAPIADGGADLISRPVGPTNTSLADWRPYCPDTIPVGRTGSYSNDYTDPGICVPGSMGSFKGNTINFDGTPGDKTKDNNGVDQKLLRLSLNLEWALDWGTFTYAGGITDQEAWTQLDQDYQQYDISHQQGDYTNETNQFSNEIRFSSNWDGPVQLTTGFLYWNERRKTEDSNFIIGCTRTAYDDNTGEMLLDTGGGCDGDLSDNWGNLAGGYLGNTWDWDTPDFWHRVWEQYGDNPGDGVTATDWNADTEHKSLYAALNWEISEQWKLTIEDRYVDESFRLKKPNQSSCTLLGIGQDGTIAGIWKEGETADRKVYQGTGGVGKPDPNDPGDAAAFDTYEQLCSFENSGRGRNDTWAYIEGEVSSQYHTPKVTVEWFPNEDAMVYASVGRAQKPAGINQLSGGGSAATIESEKFLPEKMTAYELGTKTTWEAAGALQVNGAMFFQDYTDKQISTQQLDDGGQLKPVITNAGGAEVWGLEADALWLPSFIDGLTLSASYTFLNAKYTEWNVNVSSIYNVTRAQQCAVVDDPGSNDPDDKLCNINFAGNALERQPENALVTQLNYTRSLGNTSMEWFVEGNSSYQDKRWIDAENSTYFDSYWLTDIRFGLLADKWDALIYINNVFDDDTIKTGGSGPDFANQVQELGFLAGFGVNHYFATAPDPRVFGIRASYRFGGD